MCHTWYVLIEVLWEDGDTNAVNDTGGVLLETSKGSPMVSVDQVIGQVILQIVWISLRDHDQFILFFVPHPSSDRYPFIIESAARGFGL